MSFWVALTVSGGLRGRLHCGQRRSEGLPVPVGIASVRSTPSVLVQPPLPAFAETGSGGAVTGPSSLPGADYAVFCSFLLKVSEGRPQINSCILTTAFALNGPTRVAPGE
jgi:hypothetical protein